MTTTKSREWFESWFDTSFYHTLYEDRDAHEAQEFLDNLLRFLEPPAGARILDVACGRGRHAVYLNNKGFDVEAYDLSASNIAYDKPFENDRLKFFIHDMRRIFKVEYFDAVFILFSSFGYFESEEENLHVLSAHATALKSGGHLLLDYLNPGIVSGGLRENEDKEAGGICFHISKSIRDGVVNKTIAFRDGNRSYEFHEKVRLYSLADFRKMFAACHLELTQVFGNYALEAYDEHRSERLILVAEKK